MRMCKRLKIHNNLRLHHKKITLKSANWTENSAKTFFFAHILHVLHLPPYTLNKILSVNCALLELLCKRSILHPLCYHKFRYNLSCEFKHAKIHTQLRSCSIPQLYELFLSHFTHYCCYKSLPWKVHLYRNIPCQIFNILTPAQANLNG